MIELTQINNSKYTSLIDATIDNDVEKVKHIIESGVIIDKMNNNGMTALMLASYSGNLDILKLLLSYDANPHLIDKSGFSSFVWAYKAKHYHILQELLIKAKMWTSCKEINKKIWIDTMHLLDNYQDNINQMSKETFNNQQIQKKKGIKIKYDSKIFKLANISESLMNCFDHNGDYFAHHDSSHWLKKKKAKYTDTLKKKKIHIYFDYGKCKFVPSFNMRIR